MKKILLLSTLGFLALGSFSAGTVLLMNNGKKESQASVGSYTANSSTYYNDITATSGTALLGQVHDLICSTHLTYTAYDDLGKNLYQQNLHQYYENGSPVSGYLYEFTSGAKWPNAWAPTAGDTTGGYNRGHIWPGADSNDIWSSGSGNKEEGAGADCHHIMPQEVRLNSSMGASLYGNATTKDSTTAKYAKLGTNAEYAFAGYNSDCFEPVDNTKGDTARVLMYVYTHYNSYTLTSVFGGNATTNGSVGDAAWFSSSSELPITNVVYGSTASDAWATLLAWNAADPVDAIETRRNDQAQIYQGNRNPFIDHPEYAAAIWGDTPLTNDPSVSFSSSSASVTVGSTVTVSASVNNGSGTISYSVTSGSSYASVDSTTGVVTGIAAGTAVVTASATVSGTVYTDTCTVTVSASGSGGSGSGSSGDYTLISSTSDVTSGDYVIAANVSGTYYALSNTISSSKIAGTSITVSNNTISSANASGFVFTIAGTSSGLTIYSSTSSKYLNPTASGTSFTASTTSANWTAATDSSASNGTFLIAGSATNVSSRCILYFTNQTTPAFGNYSTTNKSSTNYYRVELFQKVEGSSTPTMSLNSSSLSLVAGGTSQLTATMSDSSTPTISWSSNATGVATVDGGLVTAVAAGNATITASATVDSTTITATCAVVVTASSGDSSDYTLISSLTDLTSGHYVIMANVGGTYYALPNSFTTSSGFISGTDVTSSLANTNTTISEANGASYGVSITVSGTNLIISNGTTYLTGSSSSSDSSSLYANSNSMVWSATLGNITDHGTFSLTSQFGKGLIFNASTYLRFGAYSPSGVTASGTTYFVELFKKGDGTAPSDEMVSLDNSSLALAYPNTGSITSTGGGTALITATYGDCIATCIVNVTETWNEISHSTGSSTVTYEEVTDVGGLAAGDTVVFMAYYSTGSQMYAMSSTANSSNMKASAVTYDSTAKTITDTDATYEFTTFTVGYDSTYGYSFYDDTNSKYLYTNSTSANNLKETATASTYSTNNSNYWTCTYASSVMSVVNYYTSARGTMQFNYNNASPIFNCYSSASQTAVSIYKKMSGGSTTTYSDLASDGYTSDALTFAHKFLSTVGGVCDSNGNTNATNLASAWSSITTLYNALSDTSKNMLLYAEASSGGDTIQKAVALYDYIVGKYGSTTYADIFGRNPASLSKVTYEVSDSNALVMVMFAIGLISITGISFYFYKKKKVA